MNTGQKAADMRGAPPADAPDEAVIAYFERALRVRIKHEGVPALSRDMGLARETLLGIASGAPIHRGTISTLRLHLHKLAAAAAKPLKSGT